MGQTTEISWCDHTYNAWWGCTKVGNSPACDNCYAETWAKRTGFQIWGDQAERRYFENKHWLEPMRWDAAAKKAEVMRRVFCMSMGDWAEGRPEQAPHLKKLWSLISQTDNLNWLMLTKRPQLISKLCPFENHPRVWQGVTAETQAWLDLRWDHLKRVESEVYWLSIEPLFERMVLPQDFLDLGQRGWAIVGGESGSGARPMDPKWARHLRDQCQEANVPFHFKQWGEWGPIYDLTRLEDTKEHPWDDNESSYRVGKKAAGALLDGREWREFPLQSGIGEVH